MSHDELGQRPWVTMRRRSATHSWLMALASNWRLTKSGAGRWRLSRSVVRTNPRLRLTPRMWPWRIRRATRLRLATILV